MIRQFALVSVLLSATLGLSMCTNRSLDSVNRSNAMSTSAPSPASVTTVNLIAREQQRLLIGQSSTSDRDIGFATIFLHIENNQNANTALIIQRIEILDTTDETVQLVSQAPQTVLLHPLERAIHDVHLTNKTGYGDCDRVKAIVTYRVGDQIQVIESNSVTIEHI